MLETTEINDIKIEVHYSGSTGNLSIIDTPEGSIMIDCGINKKTLLSVKKFSRVNTLLLTHRHGDHVHKSGIKQLLQRRPSIKVLCNADTFTTLETTPNNSKIMEPGDKVSINDNLHITAIKAYHDVPCNGYIITYKDTNILYMTDTNSTKGIPLNIQYDVIMLETNYCLKHITMLIAKSKNPREFDKNLARHLSKQDALKFKAMFPKALFMRLHKSQKMYK